ncbi:FtsX-like permease family protein [Micromonospora sp. NPDC049102]|uniref:FtsX-like permease family protein n=1 Tax=Micromonospora sp. NPDC049102 TaxID=3364265 RepID=UPI00371C3D68
MAHVAQARRPYPLLVAAVVLLVLGAAMAWAVGDTLGLSHAPAVVPREEAVAAPTRTPAPLPPLASLVVPDEPRLTKAAAAVADAVVRRGLPRPALVPAAPNSAGSATAPPGTGTARRAAPDLSAVRTLRASVLTALGGTPESYRLDVRDTELTVQGGDVAGVAAGMYRLADRISSGADAIPAADAGRMVTPRLELRLTDAGSVGREPEPAVFAAGDDYGLNTDVVGSAVLPRAPWVDAGAVARIGAQFRQFVDHSVAQGFNGIVVPGFLEYVTFAEVGDGHAVYPPGDPHVDRARALVAAFGPVFRYAEDMGVRVFLLTDMLAVSPPLEAYLTRTVGGLDVADPRLWSVYQAGLAELFESMPFVDGLMVRIGEGVRAVAERLTATQSSAGTLAERVIVAPAGLPTDAARTVREWPGVQAATGVHRTQVVVRALDGIEPISARSVDPAADTALTTWSAGQPDAQVLDAATRTRLVGTDLALGAWLHRLLIGVMVGYAAVAAATTMVMAALARRRELALLQLVGVTRGQIRGMVQAEQAGLLGTAVLIGATIAVLTLSAIVYGLTGSPIPYVPPLGWVAVLGGTTLPALTATVWPVRRLLNAPPIDDIGVKE